MLKSQFVGPLQIITLYVLQEVGSTVMYTRAFGSRITRPSL